MATPDFALPDYLTACQQRVNDRLAYWLDQQSSLAPRLLDAMRYATFNGGKRIRPVLVFAACDALGGEWERALDAAAALEMVHSYSLVHDDLPAMDDDALRRGKPTCHIAFDEATAILAGDALQCLAFEVIAGSPLTDSDTERLRLITLLANASGVNGMAGGQALDLAAEGCQLTLPELERIHRHKTGQLIQASVAMGAVIAGCDQSSAQYQALQRYATVLGLAFQVQDDILDDIGDTQLLGKQQGADRALNKSTYPTIMGLADAQAFAQSLCQQAIDALTDFDDQALALRELAHYTVNRVS